MICIHVLIVCNEYSIITVRCVYIVDTDARMFIVQKK